MSDTFNRQSSRPHSNTQIINRSSAINKYLQMHCDLCFDAAIFRIRVQKPSNLMSRFLQLLGKFLPQSAYSEFQTNNTTWYKTWTQYNPFNSIAYSILQIKVRDMEICQQWLYNTGGEGSHYMDSGKVSVNYIETWQFRWRLKSSINSIILIPVA